MQQAWLRPYRVLAIVGFVLCTGMGAAPPALMVGSQQARPGAQGIQVPLMLRTSKDSRVVALQAELRYDPARLHLHSTSAGPVTEAAGKQLSTNAREPGVLKLILFGLNKRPLQSGVIASLIFDVDADARPDAIDVQITRVSATDMDARPITLQGVNGRITLRQ